MRVQDMVEVARAADDRGFSGVYLPEAWRSAFVAMTAVAAATGGGRGRIELGPYVLNAHAHSPLFTGIAAVDLDEFSGGRLVLGVGSGNRVTNEQYQGIPVERPLAKMRDFIEVVNRVKRAGIGDRVDFEGPVHQTAGWYSQVQPVRNDLPVVLAATSPKMTQLAAEVADGIAMGSLLSVEYVADVAARCRAIAERPFRVMVSAFVSPSADRREARDAARTAVVNLYAGKPHPHYDSLLRQQGFADVANAISVAVGAGDLDAARAAVSDDVVDRLTIAGTPEECRHRIMAYAPHADDLILVNVAGMRFQAGAHGGGKAPRGDLNASFEPILALRDA
ncbi:LLM class flavin-dependent oxidoreductase [Nocardioides sp. YIM 152315]|uniref:LLM class flavin-dependent oxidoreductase n=1 Tax=Nocardioides sp. YIM 152315 TaxID=3031760 RepID=UPI0023D97BB1|nr:LLM class flavin-dependent oxidoreductase [Nocardioides sp. YIM 152315]MDF1602250.1 LLM class flavin-dependent oxidoreductase [Nocardioides sp. YIM 152315]